MAKLERDNYDKAFKEADYPAIYQQRHIMLKRILASKSIHKNIVHYYSRHPAAFINDWMDTYPVSYTHLTLPTILLV